MKEFWNELLTRASWDKLKEMSKESSFILIGGWAIYLWTKAHKSKDIDIIVDYETLEKLSKRYTLSKNDRLKKYEIKEEDFDIDIYLPYYSKLAIPAEKLEKHTTSIEGIKTVTPEVLLILKQSAEIDRRGSLKGRKDLIDIITLLVHAPFNIEKYQTLLVEYKKPQFKDELKTEIELISQRDLDYMGLNKHSFAKWKKEFYKQQALYYQR